MIQWHRESSRSYTAHIGVLYIGTVREWTPDAFRFPNPQAILEKPWRASFSSHEDDEFELGRYSTELEAKIAVEQKAPRVLQPVIVLGEHQSKEKAVDVINAAKALSDAFTSSGWHTIQEIGVERQEQIITSIDALNRALKKWDKYGLAV